MCVCLCVCVQCSVCEATPNRGTTGECYIPLTLYGRGRGSSAVWLPGSPPHGPGARETSGRSRVTCRGGPTRASCLEGPRGRGRPLDACSAACDSSSSRKTWRGGRERKAERRAIHTRGSPVPRAGYIVFVTSFIGAREIGGSHE